MQYANNFETVTGFVESIGAIRNGDHFWIPWWLPMLPHHRIPFSSLKAAIFPLGFCYLVWRIVQLTYATLSIYRKRSRSWSTSGNVDIHSLHPCSHHSRKSWMHLHLRVSYPFLIPLRSRSWACRMWSLSNHSRPGISSCNRFNIIHLMSLPRCWIYHSRRITCT